MMNDQQLTKYFQSINLAESACEYIRRVRTNEPARLVGTNASTNVCSWVASVKMGHQIQTESRGVERAFVTEFEYSSDVIEYWDQPEPVTVRKTNKKKRPYSAPYYADFLVLFRSGPKVIETKAETTLQKLVKQEPQHWLFDGNRYCYLPAQSAFSELGLPHTTLSASETNQIRIANLRLLTKARYAENKIDSTLAKKIKKTFERHAYARLSDIAKITGQDDLTSILQLIDRRVIYADIDRQLLSEPESTWVASSPDFLTICLEEECRNSESIGLKTDFDSVSVSRVPTAAAAEKALKRLERINSGQEEGRSIRRWKNRIKEGEKKALSSLQSLIDRDACKGNRKARLNSIITDWLEIYIQDEYADTRKMTAYSAHKEYVPFAKRKHPKFQPVSLPTFRRYIEKYDPEKINRKRGGRRLANAMRSPTAVEDRILAATVPFELAYIDHYLADIFLIVVKVRDVTYIARPWITGMIDQVTGSVLAFWISFRDPSTRQSAMVIRLCVRRHKMLPAEILTDRGSDFRSVFVQALMAHLQVHFSLRPAEHPRAGGSMERFFGALKAQCLAMRPGNLANYKAIRSLSGEFRPDKHAVLTLEGFLDELCLYVDWRDANKIGLSIDSPEAQIKQNLTKYSCVPVRVIENHDFIVATAVDVRNYTLDPQRGIHIDEHFYYHPGLSGLRRKSLLSVRIEPENPYVVYALHKNRWLVCSATGLKRYERMQPIARLAETIRISDGRRFRDAAKKEADYDLIKRLNERNHEIAPNETLILNQDTTDNDDDIFSITTGSKVNPLRASRWTHK